MDVLVLAPMLSESANFTKALLLSKKLKHSYKVVTTGVGKVNMASTLALELTKDYDLVALIGYAAGSDYFNQGDLVIPSEACYHDVSVPKGLVPDLENVYDLEGSDDVVVLTGDSFVTKDLAESLVSKYSNRCIFDMEACAAAQVLSEYSIPCLVMKLISDIPQDGNNLQSFEDFCKTHTDFSVFLNYIEML